MFMFSLESQPWYSNEYYDAEYTVSVVDRAMWPAPRISVPIDGSNVHPRRRQHLTPMAGRRTLVLDSAYFWDNAEQLDCPHGETAKIDVRVCTPDILNYTFEELRRDPSIYQKRTVRSFNVPGPVYLAYPCSSNPFTDPAYNEWLDGVWGVTYTNMGIIDWSAEHPAIDTYVLVFEEGDQTNPRDLLGEPIIVRRDEQVGVRQEYVVGFRGRVAIRIVDNPQLPVRPDGVFVWHGWSGVLPLDTFTNEVCIGSLCGGERIEGSPYYPCRDFEEGYRRALAAGVPVMCYPGGYPAARLGDRVRVEAVGGGARFGTSH